MAAISEFDSFEQVIGNMYGKGITVKEKRRVSGGYINEAFLLILSDGNSVFLKENTKENAEFFSAEKGCFGTDKSAVLSVQTNNA